jgi:hypothetical protein
VSTICFLATDFNTVSLNYTPKCHCTKAHLKSSLHNPTAIFLAFLAELNFRLPAHLELRNSTADSESELYVTTDGQPASLSWNKAPFRGLRPDFYYCLTVAGLLILGALSDERTSLSFTIAAAPRQRSNFRVRVP